MASNLTERFQQYIKEHRLFDHQQRLFVAVSGGIDSVVLCYLLQRVGYSFAVAHCHFGLREAESDRDAAFVQQLALSFDAPFYIKHFDTALYAQEHKLSIQEAARQLRYGWFNELVRSQEPGVQSSKPALNFELPAPDSLLTAHHLDDNIETVLMNFFKGTGISGLRGMLPKQDYVVRPLLFARRAELEAYALQEGLQWVEDSSNAQTKYTRNFFRHEVLPLVTQKFPQALDNVAHSLPRFAEVEHLYLQAINEYRKNLLQQQGDEVFIPVLKLAKAKPLYTITFELLKPFGFTAAQTGAVLRLLQSESGRYVSSATHQVVRHRRWLVIAPLQSQEVSLLVLERDREKVRFGNAVMRQQEQPIPKSLISNSNTAFIDEKLLQYPLILRRWKAGDYFYPLGFRKKKKVSRLLIDLKLSKIEKENIWVLESGKKIAWVVGLRLDERFKVTGATQKVVRFTVDPTAADNAVRH